jgi:hypothetical protein
MHTRRAVIIGSAAAIVTGLYFGVWALASPEAAPTARELTFRLQLDREPPIFQATEGDQIRLAITSARAGELYVHGPNMNTLPSATVFPETETVLAFLPAHAGRYFVHLHEVGCKPNHGQEESGDNPLIHTELAAIDVTPR